MDETLYLNELYPITSSPFSPTLILIKSNLLSFLQVPIDSMLSSAQSPGSEKSCNSVELAADKVFRRRDPKNGSGMTSYLSSSFNCVFAQATLSVRRIIQLMRFQDKKLVFWKIFRKSLLFTRSSEVGTLKMDLV